MLQLEGDRTTVSIPRASGLVLLVLVIAVVLPYVEGRDHDRPACTYAVCWHGMFTQDKLESCRIA